MNIRDFLHGITALAFATALFASCASGGAGVKYTVAHNYFVNRNAAIPQDMKIQSQKEFDRCFGMAATMGKDGKPTEIDFAKSFVIAKVMHVTDTMTEVSPLSLKKGANGSLVLKSAVKTGEKTSYFMQPFYIIIVDRKYAGCKITESE